MNINFSKAFTHLSLNNFLILKAVIEPITLQIYFNELDSLLSRKSASCNYPIERGFCSAHITLESHAIRKSNECPPTPPPGVLTWVNNI